MIYKYFSASNTPNGFVNHFDKSMDFDSASQIIYIKGGSGIGKSTLMRRVSDRAVREGLDVHQISCSSDRESLDGVIVPARGIAVFDATMPHIADPMYPRINGRIVDLGVFLDENRLKTHRSEVIALTKDKKAHYNTMYTLLAVIEGIMSAMAHLVDVDEIGVSKVVREIISNTDTTPIYPLEGFLSLIDKDGYIDMTEGILDSKKCYQVLSSVPIVATDIINRISNRLEPISHQKYYSVLDSLKAETIVTHGEILTSSKKVKGDIIYNVDNLININNRHAYNILIDMKDEIIGMASGEIACAKELHQSIEKIYRSCMDFDTLTAYEEKLVESLFV